MSRWKSYTLSMNEAILSYLQRAIQLVAGEYSLSGCIIDTCENVDLLIDGIERVLNCGRKSEFFGETSYWEIFCSMKKISWLQEPVQWIEKDITNPSGRGRAFLRYCLNRKLTTDVYLAMKQSGIINDYYKSDCIFLRTDNHQLFFQQLESLKGIDFSLSLNEEDKKVKGVFSSTEYSEKMFRMDINPVIPKTEFKKPIIPEIYNAEPKEPKIPEISNTEPKEPKLLKTEHKKPKNPETYNTEHKKPKNPENNAEHKKPKIPEIYNTEPKEPKIPEISKTEPKEPKIPETPKTESKELKLPTESKKPKLSPRKSSSRIAKIED